MATEKKPYCRRSGSSQNRCVKSKTPPSDKTCLARPRKANSDSKYTTCKTLKSNNKKTNTNHKKPTKTIVPHGGPSGRNGSQHVWKKKPGEKGFNKYVVGLMRDADMHKGVVSCDFKMQSGSKKETTYQRYQSILGWLCSPHTPIDRLLVQWQLGTGKTLGMIKILDNYFKDERPKILVFPNDELVRNFYRELADKPNLYRSAYDHAHGAGAMNQERSKLMIKWCEDVIRIRKRDDDEDLFSPMRAFTYAQLGGSYLKRNSILNWHGRGKHKGKHSLDGVIVIADEAHNMIHPGDKFKNDRQRSGMRNAGSMIRKSSESVAALFTATPIVKNRMKDFFDLMKIVTGSNVSEASMKNGALEGYLSSYMTREQDVFPTTHPDADDIPTIRTCVLRGRMLREYIAKRFFENGRLPPCPKGGSYILNQYTGNYVLDNATNRKKIADAKQRKDPIKKAKSLVCLDSNDLFPATRKKGVKPCPKTLQRYENQIKKDACEPPDSTTGTLTKLESIAAQLVGENLKTIVLMHKSSSMRVLENRVEAERSKQPKKHQGGKVVFIKPAPSSELAKDRKARKDEEEKIVKRFNETKNAKGSSIKALVLPAEDYTEGVSFIGVRRVMFPDISQDAHIPSWAMMKQRIARAVRLCSHKIWHGGKWVLSKDEQRVDVSLYVSALPSSDQLKKDVPELTDSMVKEICKQKTVDQAKLEHLMADRIRFEEDMKKVDEASIEHHLM